MKSIHVRELDIGDDWFSGEVFSFSADTYSSFKKELQKESDRSVVLMTASILDTVLTERIQRMCIAGAKKTVKRLFAVGGPFDSFSSKIDWLYCNGQIPKESHHDLHSLRQLRNHCAHNWQSFSLDQDIEREYLSKMAVYSFIGAQKKWILKREKLHRTHQVVIPPRMVFIFLMSVLISSLNAVHTVRKSVEDLLGP